MMAAQIVAASHRSGADLTSLLAQEGSHVSPECACATTIGGLFEVLAGVSEGIDVLAAGIAGDVGLLVSLVCLFPNC